jgi:D-beta-D-heptose 7-phosphate kinase/D-beta-D-heptose 1-phosphate adenosyltransferase
MGDLTSSHRNPTALASSSPLRGVDLITSRIWDWVCLSDRRELLEHLAILRASGAIIVTTNGCFDLLHLGHLRLLETARAFGDVLVVALNSDASVQRCKGSSRPLLPALSRAALLAALRPVDLVVVFDDPTPCELLRKIRPDVHCKGGDYRLDDLPEASIVIKAGGRVELIPHTIEISTTAIVNQIVQRDTGAQQSP